jgi:hypothetical protein
VRTHRLSASAVAVPVKPGGEDAGVVKNHKIAFPQQVRELAEVAIRPPAGRSLYTQHAGAVAGGGRFLSNKLFGKMEVEVRNQHDFRL